VRGRTGGHDEAVALDVVIVSYRARQLLRDCLQSLRENPPRFPMRVTVVDNASGDGTVDMVSDEFPEVELIISEENRGFGAANNVVIRQSTARYVLALNPDTRVTPGALDRLIELMDSRPDVGICGCRLVLEDGSFDHAAKRSFPSPLSALGHFTGLAKLVRAEGILAQYHAPSVEAGRVDAVNGAFMLMRRTALEAVGGFDESYWMYMEDLDLCYRFAQAGWITWYEPSVTVVHVKAGTTGRYRHPRLNYAFHYGMYRFYRMHYAAQRRRILNVSIYAGIAVKLCLSVIHSALRRRVFFSGKPPVIRDVREQGPLVAGGAEVRPGDVRIDAKTAIVHDWFQGFHGSERVVEAIRTSMFGADNPPDVFTFNAALEILPDGLAASIVQQSRLASLPVLRQQRRESGHWRYLLPYMPYYFRHLDLDAYDVVIASSHACAVNVRPRSDAVFVCYCHTPMRYAWLPETDERVIGARSLALRTLRGWLRRVDREAAQRPDAYIANSSAVRERIKRFYGRDSVVIHPPVEVDDLSPGDDRERDRFLWVHRLVDYKRPDLVVEAFRELPYRLTMVGVGPQERRLRRTLPPNVELRGWIPRRELARLYATSLGFIHLGEEDFGISMVEALAAGTPVIAYNQGGARDIVEHGRHGLLLDDPTPEKVRQAITDMMATRWDRAALAEHAAGFSRARFVAQLAEYLQELGAAVETAPDDLSEAALPPETAAAHPLG
jgi:GT2 family glycosyltransferase/glycosyltransferase involved in cell wall biosynthesis